MSRNKKKTAQMRHAQRRACERYDIELTKEVHDFFIRAIRSKDLTKAVKLWQQSIRVAIYKVRFETRWIPVVYDKQRVQIVTFLPIEALEGLEKDFDLEDLEDPI